MTAFFAGYEVDEEFQPVPRLFDFDLDQRLSSVVALEAWIPEDAFSARSMRTHRVGNAIVIGAEGLMLTVSYLITEAEQVVVSTNDGLWVPAHVLGVDAATGFALIHALEPLGLPALAIGDSRKVRPEAALISAGGGGREHALCGQLLARQPYAGYWEYYLDEALFVEPAHPHWSGGALIGPGGDLVGLGSLRMEQLGPKGDVRPFNMFVPAELLPPILDDLTHGRAARPPRPWLGVLSREIAAHVVIDDVTQGGPAARAELRPGDVVLQVAGERVSDLAGFYKQLWALGGPGVVAPLRIRRESDVFEVEVRTADRASMHKKRRLN